jgi:hypothetical protein
MAGLTGRSTAAAVDFSGGALAQRGVDGSSVSGR